MCHPSLYEPVGQRQEFVGHGAKGLQFGYTFGGLSCAIRHQTTGGDTLFMYIEPRTIRKDHLHLASPLRDWASGIPLCIKPALRARLPQGSWRHFVVLTGIRVQLCHRLTAPTQHDLATSPEETILCFVRGLTKASPFSCFVVPRGA